MPLREEVRLDAGPPKTVRTAFLVSRTGAFDRYEEEMKNLFAGNLSFQTTEAELRALFEPFGQVGRVHLAMDRETGRARGFGFVEMPNDEEAKKAMAALDGKDVGGRNIKVNEARPRGTGSPRRDQPAGGYGRAGGGGRGRHDSPRDDYADAARQPREPRW
jgi:cold-inducible RNA-binding protein